MDPIAAARLWLLIRPIRRLKSWRKRRKMASWFAEHGGRPADEFSEFLQSDEEIPVSDLWKSHGRSVLKALGAVLVTLGVTDPGDVDAVLQALELLTGAASLLYGVYASHKTHG